MTEQPNKEMSNAEVMTIYYSEHPNEAIKTEKEIINTNSLPLPPPPPEPKQQPSKPDSPNLISFRSGLGWIVASILGGALIVTVLMGVL